ncbi:MAG: polyketide cyclase [Alistipes sp.]|jgi:carbon monoxide dehydrogenase subunit G|nr:polyketide cyclase [Alistipes sp.]
MEKYESKQQQIFKSAAQIYPLISDFSLLTPAVADKVEEWEATSDTCSFKVKGFTVKLRMVDKVECKHVKITGDEGGVPIDFSFWIQLHEVTPTDTRMRMVLHADLNMMMRMMVGSKLQKGLDQAAETFAAAFNRF